MTLYTRGASAAADGLALCSCAVMVTSTVDGGHRSSLGEKLIFKDARFPEQFTPTGWADLSKSRPRRSRRVRGPSGELPTDGRGPPRGRSRCSAAFGCHRATFLASSVSRGLGHQRLEELFDEVFHAVPFRIHVVARGVGSGLPLSRATFFIRCRFMNP